MPKTAVADIIVPSLFAPYVREQVTARAGIIKSGLAGQDREFDEKAASPGTTVNMPFWKEITGSSEVLSDSADLAVNKITTGQDVAHILNRGKAWAVNDLAKWLSGDDPAREIAGMVADWAVRDSQEILLKLLDGLFDNANGVLRNTHRLNIYSDVQAGSITDPMRLNGVTFIDGLTKLGDANRKLTGVLMHSDTEAHLKKLELIDAIPDSEGKEMLQFFQGKRVIVDDACPKVAGTNSPAYTTYLYGKSAVAWGNAELDPEEAIETGRVVLASDTVLAYRRRMIMHPRGVKWIGTPAGSSATNAELATGTNWSKAWEDKHIRLVAIRHNI